MSSDSIDKDLTLALRRMEQAWDALARHERNLTRIPPRPRRASLPAASAAWMLDITYQASGAARVRINEQHEFLLASKLAQLLELLAADTDRCDGIVGWKPASAIRAALAETPAGIPLSAHALNQLAYRLRLELAGHGVHPGLVQYHRAKRAFRFALRPA